MWPKFICRCTCRSGCGRICLGEFAIFWILSSRGRSSTLDFFLLSICFRPSSVLCRGIRGRRAKWKIPTWFIVLSSHSSPVIYTAVVQLSESGCEDAGRHSFAIGFSLILPKSASHILSCCILLVLRCSGTRPLVFEVLFVGTMRTVECH